MRLLLFWHSSKVITIWENLVLPPKPDDLGLTGMYVRRIRHGECVVFHDMMQNGVWRQFAGHVKNWV